MTGWMTVVLSSGLYGVGLWGIVRLLDGRKSRAAVGVAVVTGLVVLFLSLLGGAFSIVGVVLATALAMKALTRFDVGLVVSVLAAIIAVALMLVVRLLSL